jgi:phosphoglycolate phosphatase-like HAD superfamily hydrolase
MLPFEYRAHAFRAILDQILPAELPLTRLFSSQVVIYANRSLSDLLSARIKQELSHLTLLLCDGKRQRNEKVTRFLVTDLDNTIIDSRERFRRSIAEALGYSSSASRFPTLDPKTLSRVQRDRFYDVFLSGEYTDLDIPVNGSVEVLSRLRSVGMGIVYLTGRHHSKGESMKDETLKTLSRFGFPMPNGGDVVLYMKPRKSSPTDEFKRTVLEQLSRKLYIVVGLDDEINDLRVMVDLIPMVIGVALSSEVAQQISSKFKIPIAMDWFEVELILFKIGIIPGGNETR